MKARFAAYLAASNRTFAYTFPAAVVLAATMYYRSASWFWLVPAVTAAIEAMAKLYDIRNRTPGA